MVGQPIEGLVGWRHVALGDVASTNTECINRAKEGDLGQLWITAERQLAGKARRGRVWTSEAGNLYASLLLVDPAPLDKMSTLPLVVSLALHEAIGAATPDAQGDLKIKWPNDILLNGHKLSGILLEAVTDGFGRSSVVIGCGVNCSHFPDNPMYPATSLAAQGIALTPDILFAQLAKQMAAVLKIWDRGQNFAPLREEWLKRCVGLGAAITARFPDHEVTGTFVDLDEEGYLLLRDDDGGLRQISAADIFFGNSGTDGA